MTSFVKIVGTLTLCATVEASVRPLSLSTSTKLEAPRWMFEPSDNVSSKGVAKNLFAIRRARNANDDKRCLRAIKKIWKTSPGLLPWLLLERLKCAQIAVSKNKKATGDLTAALAYLDSKPSWLVTGPYVKPLKSETVKSHLVLLKATFKVQRKKAWDIVNRLHQMRPWMSVEQKAKVFRWAGELAFLQQNLLLAQDYIRRSLSEKESRELRRKLKSIQSHLALDKIKTTVETPEQAVQYNKELDATEKELKLFKQVERTLKIGDWVSAVDDGVQLIKKYPGGKRAEWASKKIIRVYRRVAQKRDRKWVLIRRRVVGLMKDVDGDRLLSWAKRAFGWGYYDDALSLSQEAVDKLGGLHLSTKALLLAGRSANTIGEYKKAERLYQEVIEKHAGSEESLEAHFRLGLLYYRQKNYSQAVGKLERLMSITTESDFDLRTRYWLWRSLQALKSEKAPLVGENLFKRYPLTYYGLRALNELSSLKNFIKKEKIEPIEDTYWLSESDNQIWERFNVLLKGGWFKEAQAELAYLPDPQSPSEKLIWSNLWSRAMNHFKAITLAQKAWDEDRSLLNRENVQLSFPIEFKSYVKKWSKKNGVDPLRVHALIKQESSYRSHVMSPSGAVGLMQIMMPTARDIAKNLKFRGAVNRISMTEPHLNIRFGVSYLRRLLRAYNGHYPLALAAYNVGIGNMRKWLRFRTELEGLSQRGSEPENEIWVDELAWEETSHYVKAVLRNYLIYQILHRSKTQFEQPVWQASSSVKL